MGQAGVAELASDWYAANARDLPWRRPGTSPYAVLVSEVMLQQTPVSRVLPAFADWIARWPTAASLAAAPSGEAVRQWGRLGYPRRALRLHAACVAIVERHGGEVPSSVAELEALPGIGTYTARALAAFAFRQRVPVVDVNVARVVARTGSGVADGPSSVGSRLLAEVEALLPADAEEAATASVALMELGALVCTARSPRCDGCPVAGVCAWRLAGSPVDPLAPPKRGQTYAGTDRQVRGRLLAVLREADGAVTQRALDATWPDPVQRARALDGLVADGLVVPLARGRYALPG
ncbi:MAG TPA: A/G-specific adenine glycosylase [Mycobacteriales bacterium]|nr:A/G-specific adenine glycosylase [Mycobacteriales bacterium]